MRSSLHLLRVVPLALSIPLTAQAAVLPTNFVRETLVTMTTLPHDFAFLPDGRVLFANRAGEISVWAGGAIAAQIGVVPDVEVLGERGLISIAPDPGFPSNGYIYVWYSNALTQFTCLDRFTCTGDLGNPTSTNLSIAVGSRRPVLDAVPDVASNHNGGSARFGPDGMLYLSIGDDASACSSQNPSSSLGCLLRMDVSGLPAGGSATAPSFAALDPGDNPLSANLDVSQLVIAHGLRNPFRMEIDQATGNCYLGDVGQDEVEELSEYVYPSAGPLPLVNFGWPWREGLQTWNGCGGAEPPSTRPIATMGRLDTGWRTILAGPRYRNQGGAFDFGPGYEGVAFCLDFYLGDVRALIQNGTTWSALPPVEGQSGPWWATGHRWKTSMRQGPDGAIYLLERITGGANPGGSLQRLRPAGPANELEAVGGSGQRGTAGMPFRAPFVVRVRDANGQPLPGGLVNFAVDGAATLSTTNPVIADANGFVHTFVRTTPVGGPITVLASTPGSHSIATGSFFARKLEATVENTVAGPVTTLSIANRTAAPTQSVPFVVIVGLPGAPSWIAPFGPVCVDPAHFLGVVIEDAIGIFGGFSLSGAGSTGTPSLTRQYGFPPGLLTGLQLKYTAIGFDAVDGTVTLNCAVAQY